MKLPQFFLLLSLLGLASISRADTVMIVLKPAADDARPKAVSAGFTLTQTSFDEDEQMPEELQHAGAGVIFNSFKPGNVWNGGRPDFVEESILTPWGGGSIPNTDVYETGGFYFAHFGEDHYQTKLILILDLKGEPVRIVDCRGVGNVARMVWDPKAEIVYYTTLERNLGDAEDAILHAYSTKNQAPLWKSKSATAKGNFVVYQKHILTHYGFTSQDDFVNVIDKGSGEVLKKHKVKTAADYLIKMEDSVVVPCYTGVYEFTFSEK